MKKVKNEQIANKLVDAIALLKVLKVRNQEEITMIEIFLKDVSDMLKDDKKDEKKEQSTAGQTAPSKSEPTGGKTGSAPTAPVKPLAGKSLADRMADLMGAMDEHKQREIIEKEARAMKNAKEKEGIEKAMEEARRELLEKVGKLTPGLEKAVGDVKKAIFDDIEDDSSGIAEPSIGGGNAKPGEVPVAAEVWCAACGMYHGATPKEHEPAPF